MSLPSSSNAAGKAVQYTTGLAGVVRDAALATGIVPLAGLCDLSLAIISILQNTRFQKKRSLRLVEQIHQLLSALGGVWYADKHLQSPNVMAAVGQYARTLERVYSCLKAQRALGTVRRFLKQADIAAQLRECEKDLSAAGEIFLMRDGVRTTNALVGLHTNLGRQHHALLRLVSSQSITTDDASSTSRTSFNTSSSSSLSLLPACPKTFHGREAELTHLIDTLLANPARAAVIGPGGMGKTTLALATLHHSRIKTKYESRYFISCESANNYDALVAFVGSQLGLEPSVQLPGAIVQHLRNYGPTLIVFDNFETPWEPSRAKVEKFLSLLADVPDLGLLITVRGAERPRDLKWNRPFLPPLEPLSPSACRQIFIEVADEPMPEEESALVALIDHSGGIPLAVSLLANVVASEGYSSTLARWRDDNTAVISEGHDKRWNLDKSIGLSLCGPRICSAPEARNLLSLISLLPDGIRASDLIASKVPISGVRYLQSLLVRTALAYLDTKGRLKMLGPIREYIRRVHPPSSLLSRPLRIHFQHLLELCVLQQQHRPGTQRAELASHLGNIHELMFHELFTENTVARISIGDSTMTLGKFSSTLFKGGSALVQRFPCSMDVTDGQGRRWGYASECLGQPGNTQTGNTQMATELNRSALGSSQQSGDCQFPVQSLRTGDKIESHSAVGEGHCHVRIELGI